MSKLLKVLTGSFLLIAAVPSATQSFGSDSSGSFLTAVKERDGNKATGFLDAPGSTVINARDGRGEGALHMLARGRDLTWLGFMLSRDANPNLLSMSGESALLIAARIGWLQGVEMLLQFRATPDLANRLGETPLIVAVQQRQLPVIRRLLEAGANPDKRDNASGRNARDYAKLADRGGDITKLIAATAVKAKPKTYAGPKQ